jgi:hypothetical protein
VIVFLPSPTCGRGAGERVVDKGELLIKFGKRCSKKQNIIKAYPISTTLSPTLSRKRERELNTAGSRSKSKH